MKSKSVKKIVGIVVVSIVLAITAATIVLALVPKKLYNPMPTKNFSGIVVYRSTVTNSYWWDDDLPEDDEQNVVTDTLLKKIEESVQDNLLSSMFQGALGYDIEITKTPKNSDLEKLYNGTGIFCLIFEYLDNTQTLEIDGKVYKHETAFASNTIEYDRIIMPLNNSTSYEECTLYFVNGQSTEYKLTYHAHFADIWQYLIHDKAFDIPVTEGNK